MSWIEACARWYGAIALCTWATAPFVRWLCRGLADRGASIARPVALLATLYPAWLLSSLGLVELESVLVVATGAIAAGVGWGLLSRQRTALSHWLRQLVVAEIASLATFAAYVLLRGYTPQIVGTEKPMDVAFLASSARTVTMPPPDPWFAGQPINYYYLGYLIHGSIGRIAGVPPEVGFNLALATIFSMTAVAAFGAAWNVVRPSFSSPLAIWGGLFAAFLAVLAGNLLAPFRLIQRPIEAINAWWWDSGAGIGWRSSRIVCDGPRVGDLCQFPSIETINEFPFFSFLLGDLHPHLMALPLTVVAIALSWNAIGWAREGLWSSTWSRLALVIVSGALVGALYPLNAWDFPTYLVVVAFGVIVGGGHGARSWWLVAALVVASVVAWLPFWLTYVPPTIVAAQLPPLLQRIPLLGRALSLVSLHVGERTSVGEYLTIFGIPYALGVIFVSYCVLTQGDSRSGHLWRFVGVVAAASIISGVVLAAPLLPLCGIPLSLAIARLSQGLDRSPQTFALWLFALAWIISIGVEFIYLRDVFDSRMNTLFKFYYQTWILYAIASGIAAIIVWSALPRVAVLRTVATAMVAVALVLGLAYPVVAAYQWTEHFPAWHGLDGLSYGEQTDPDDVAAIRWLSTHGAAGDVVLEAAGCSYHPFNRLPFDRVSAFTGIPTVIGWDGHERQWRAGQPALLEEIRRRQADVETIFTNPESTLVDAYHVMWLFVGSYETGEWRAECGVAGPYPGLDDPKFPGEGWQEAFRSGATRIYRKVGP